jgi:phytoene dehydrogenase-like protein
LAALGFSPVIIERFFRPFFGGIFLDTGLATTSRMLYFVYRMLSQGDTAVPADGMGAIPGQLASTLPGGCVRLNTRASGVLPQGDQAIALVLDDGSVLTARAVVVATDAAQASAITGTPLSKTPRPVSCVYFSAPVSPVGEPMLVLNGEGRGPVLNLAVMTEAAPEYAPPGQHLVSAVVVTPTGGADADLEADVRAQMAGWYGAAAVGAWRHLRTYRIPWALFDQRPGTLEPAHRAVRQSAGVYVCGDHVENASINGALEAGRRAAEAVLEDLPTCDGARP